MTRRSAFHAFSRAENLFFGLGRIDEAYDVLRRAVVASGDRRAPRGARRPSRGLRHVLRTARRRRSPMSRSSSSCPSGRGYLEAATAAVPAPRDHGSHRARRRRSRTGPSSKRASRSPTKTRMAEAAIHLVTGCARAHRGRTASSTPKGSRRFGFDTCAERARAARCRLVRARARSRASCCAVPRRQRAHVVPLPRRTGSQQIGSAAAGVVGVWRVRCSRRRRWVSRPRSRSALGRARRVPNAHAVAFMRPDVLRGARQCGHGAPRPAVRSGRLLVGGARSGSRSTEQHTLAHGASSTIVSRPRRCAPRGSVLLDDVSVDARRRASRRRVLATSAPPQRGTGRALAAVAGALRGAAARCSTPPKPMAGSRSRCCATSGAVRVPPSEAAATTRRLHRRRARPSGRRPSRRARAGRLAV